MTLGNEFLLVQRWPLKMKGKMGEPWSWVDYFIYYYFFFKVFPTGFWPLSTTTTSWNETWQVYRLHKRMAVEGQSVSHLIVPFSYAFFFFFFPDKEMIGKIRKQVLMSENVSFFFQLTDSWVVWLVRTNTPLESNCQLTFWYRTKKLSRHLPIIFGLFLPPLMRPPALLYFFPLLLTR